MITNCNAKDYGIPQNRERIFAVSILGEHEPFEFPDKKELQLRLKDLLEDEVDEKYYLDNEKVQRFLYQVDYQPTEEIKLNQIGNFEKLANPSKKFNDPQTGRVLDTMGISQALDTMQGGNRQPKVLIKNATKKGYLEATEGDGIDLSYPDNQTRRGRVQKGISQTLQTSDSLGVVELPAIAASRGRNPSNPSDRTTGVPTEQRLEINKKGVSNALTTVQKDNYVLEGLAPQERTDCIGENETYTVEILRTLQKEIGKEAYAEWEDRGLRVLQEKEILRQDVYEERLDAKESRETQERKVKSSERKNEGGIFHGNQTVSEVFVDRKLGRTPQRQGSIQQFARELGAFMQELPHEKTQSEKEMRDLWGTAEGIGVLQQALYKIQKIWRPELYKKPSFRIRKLSPLECWRLMGFKDLHFYKAQEVNSNSQLYKQAGNSIVVPVLEGIFSKMFLQEESV